MASRFRIERCAAHGIAVGLCEVASCKGAERAKKVDRQLIEKIEPPRCSRCKQTRGDATHRGPFHGAKGNHPGYQERYCDSCWELKLAREQAAAVPKALVELDRLAKKRAHHALYLERKAEESESAGRSFE